MARARSRTRARPRNEAPAEQPRHPAAQARYLILFRRDSVDAGLKLLRDTLGLKFANTADAKDGRLSPAEIRDNPVLFDRLEVASVELSSEQLRPFDQLPDDSPIQIIRQEGVMSVLAVPAPAPSPLGGQALLTVPPLTSAVTPDYLRGYRDGINHLVESLAAGAALHAAAVAPAAAMTGGASLDYLRGYRDGVERLIESLSVPVVVAPAPTTTPATPSPFADDRKTTWGLQATGAADSPCSGRGIAIAVLDTGLDTKHPDFQGARVGGTVSFVVGEDAVDKHGHGTACAGIAGGPREPADGPRYGVAYEAQLFAAKVLDRTGQGTETAVLAGLNWAIASDCRVILLPCGMAPRGPRPEAFYAAVCRRALRHNAMLIAAAGGQSNRAMNNIQPATVPANGGDVIGVGAVDRHLHLANFSNGGIGKTTGSVDLVGPGVNVWTAWTGHVRRRSFSGTSAASAFVAGIAALAGQALGDAHRPCGAVDILHYLLLSASPLAAPSTDVGKGLVKAPAAQAVCA